MSHIKRFASKKMTPGEVRDLCAYLGVYSKNQQLKDEKDTKKKKKGVDK